MRNHQVVEAWALDQPANSGRMITDGDRLWSYALVIGFTDEDGKKVALDYTAPVGWFRSMTTSCHVGLAKGVADRVEELRRDR